MTIIRYGNVHVLCMYVLKYVFEYAQRFTCLQSILFLITMFFMYVLNILVSVSRNSSSE